MSQEANQQPADPASWVDRYGDYLYSYAYYRVDSQETAADLVQETFLSALKSYKNFKGKSTERTWLISILKRKVIDHYRTKSRETQNSATSNLPFDEQGKWKNQRTPEGIPEPEDTDFDKDEFYRILRWCMSVLPDKWQAVFRLKALEEQESDTVCKEMKISPSNFWVIMHRTRLQLRECFEKNWF